MQNEPRWYIMREGRELGPFSLQHIQQMYATAQFSPTDLLWREGWPEWSLASSAVAHVQRKSPQERKRAAGDSAFWIMIAALVGVVGALGGGLLSNWHNFFPVSITVVEGCDKSLGPVINGHFAGVYSGLVEDGQGRAEVQIRLVRNGDAVLGNYFRDGTCGSVFGQVEGDRLRYNWKWAGGAGMGLASQQGETLRATSGYDNTTEGAGSLILYQRPAR